LSRKYGIVKEGDLLHRFPSSLNKAGEMDEMQWRTERLKAADFDVWLKDDNTVNEFGISWLEKFEKNTTKIGTCLAARPINRSHQLMAVHTLLNSNGQYDKCEMAAVSEVDDEREKFEQLTMTNGWSKCPYFPPNLPGGPPMNAVNLPGGADICDQVVTYKGKLVYYIPEPEGDWMNLMAHIYLERLAMDVTQDIHDRRSAMTYMFEMVDIEFEEDLPRHPCAPDIVRLLRKSLVLKSNEQFIKNSWESYQLLGCIDYWLLGEHIISCKLKWVYFNFLGSQRRRTEQE
jgi:hypothetical protein